MNCALSQTTLHGYFDGELDAVRSAEFERHLESCAECQAELKEVESLRTLLHTSNLHTPASPQLRQRIRKQITGDEGARRVKSITARRWFLFPAFGALAATAAAVLITFFVFQSRNESTRVTAELIDAHVRSLQPGHLTDVVSTDQHTVKPWFDGKVDFIPPVTDFAQQGYPLVGGRLDVVDSHSVAAVVYSRRKHLINLFVWPYHEKERTMDASGFSHGYNWTSWRTGDMQFCLISDVSASDLHELEGMIRQ